MLISSVVFKTDDDDDVYLEYYSGKGFHINYSCLHVLRKTYKQDLNMLLIAFADADLVRAVSDYKEQKKGGKSCIDIYKYIHIYIYIYI
jgi:hypothetical protein